jgi:hypothetical protein
LTPEEVISFYHRLGLEVGASSGQIKAAVKNLEESQKILTTGLGPIIDPNQGRKETPGESKTRFFKGSLAADQKIKEDDKSKDDPAKTFKTQVDAINAAARTAQVAMKNLADQGSNSLSILVKNSAPHVKTLQTYFGVTVVAALHTSQTAFADLAIQGSNSLSILIKNAKPHVTTLQTYFGTTVFQALVTALGGFIALEQQGSEDMALLVKNVRPHVVTLNTYFGTTIPNAVDKSITAFNDGADAADDFTSSLSKLEKQAKATAAAIKKIPGGGGGGLNFGSAQTGMHKVLDNDTLILAHEGERVDIGQQNADSGNTRRRSIGGSSVINLTVVTHNELDGEKIGTTVTRKTFNKLSTR